MKPLRILFLCTGNSCRSQMAEGLARELGKGMLEAWSAGSNPRPIHPLAIEAMRKVNIDISGYRSKHLNAFAGQRFDYVITVCDRLKETCPTLPDATEQLHWSFEDPASAIGALDHRQRAFDRVREEIRTRIQLMLIAQSISRMRCANRCDSDRRKIMKTVLFACIHNAGRSQMAAALFNLLADPRQAKAFLPEPNRGRESSRSPSGDEGAQRRSQHREAPVPERRARSDGQSLGHDGVRRSVPLCPRARTPRLAAGGSKGQAYRARS